MSAHRLQPLLPFSSNPIPLEESPVQPNRRAGKRSAPRRRHHHADSDWDHLKATILQLYIAENKSADDVVELLVQDYGFKASRRKLLEKLNEWGVGKKLKRGNIKILLAKKNARLRNEGKDTEFFLNGQPLTVERLDRSIQRSGCSLGQEPSPSAETPVGITYHTPQPSGSGAVLKSQSRHQELPPYPATVSEMLVTTTIGYLAVMEPDAQQITHKHQLGRYSITSAGVDLSDTDRRHCTFAAHEMGLRFRMSITALAQAASRARPGRSTPETCTTTSSLPGCWVKWSDGYGFGDMSLIWDQLKDSRLYDIFPCLQPEINMLWNHGRKIVHFDQLREKEQNIAAQVETMFPSQWRDDGRLVFLDIFLVLATESKSKSSMPPIMKISLGLDSQPGPPCSICETDIFTIDIINSTGAIAVQAPLSKHNQSLGPEQKFYFQKTAKRSTWKDIASQCAGWESSAPCATKAVLEPRREYCLTRYEVEYESGEWDPHGAKQRPERFQTFPLDRGHVCCNKSCGEYDIAKKQQFRPHPGEERREFQPRPRREEVWDPDGVGAIQADVESDEYEDL